MELSFEIDKITESIELAKTNERFETIINSAAAFRLISRYFSNKEET